MATVQPHRVRAGRGVELGLLVLALVIGVASYALVGIGTDGQGPARRDRVRARHGGARRRHPPGAALACAVRGPGDPADHRGAQRHRAGDDLPDRLRVRGPRARRTGSRDRQLVWTAISVVLAAAVADPAAGPPHAAALHVHRDGRRSRADPAAAGARASGVLINGARIWVRVGGVGFQPAEFAKIAFAIFFAGYLVTHRDTLALAGPKVLGPAPAAGAGPRSDPHRVGRVGRRPRPRARPRHVAAVLRPVRRDALPRHRAAVAGWSSACCCSSSARSSPRRAFSHVGARFDAWLHAFDPAVFDKAYGGSGQLVRGLFGMASGGLFGTGLGRGPAGPGAVRGVGLHRRVARRGARPDRAASRS